LEPALRAKFLLPTIFFGLAGPALADAPFTTDAKAPDYVMTMVARSHGREYAEWQVAHHERWTRIDRVADGSRTTEYVSADGRANVTNSDRRVISFRRGLEPSYNRDNEPRNTGERQTVLGELCTVWNVWRITNEQYGPGFSQLSCVTDDGIEMWQRMLRGDDAIQSAEATRIERRPVPPSEVQPPRELLTLDWWEENVPAPTAPGTPDHETVMELSGDGPGADKSVRTVRRLGPWQSLQETVNGVLSTVQITHDSLRMRFEYTRDKSGTPERLSIARLISVAEDIPISTLPIAGAMRPKDLNLSETILGETCRWFDMMPGMSDKGQSACLTHDGIVLRDRRWSRGSRREWTAVQVTQRPVSLNEIMPPAELVDPKTWGID
jgi:hypothetical protein